MTNASGLGLRRVLHNATKTAGRHVFAGVLNFATVALIARGYGPAGNGLYAVALLVPTLLATALGLGMASANAYYVGSGRVGPRAALATTMRIWVSMGLFGLACGAAFIYHAADRYFPGISTAVIWVALFCFPPLLLSSFIGSIFQGLQDFTLYNASLSVQPVTVLVGVGVCMATGAPPLFLVVSYLCGTILASLLMTLLLLRKLRGVPPEQGPRYSMGMALSYGGRSGLGNIVALLNYRVNLFLLNMLFGPVSAGLHAVALQVAEKLWLLSQAVSTVLLPKLSSVSTDRIRSVAITQVVTRVTLAATGAAAVLLGALSFTLIPWVFGEVFRAAVLPLVILLPGIVAVSAVRVLSSEISARGKPEINLYIATAVGVVNLLLAVVLIPLYGIAGAALATTIAFLVNLGIRVRYFCRLSDTPPGDLLVVKGADFNAVMSLVREHRASRSLRRE